MFPRLGGDEQRAADADEVFRPGYRQGALDRIRDAFRCCALDPLPFQFIEKGIQCHRPRVARAGGDDGVRHRRQLKRHGCFWTDC